MYRCKEQHASCLQGQRIGPVICYLLLCMQSQAFLLTADSRRGIIARHSSCMGIVGYCIDLLTGCCQVEATWRPRSLLSTNICICTWPSCPSCFCTQWRAIGIFNGVSYLFQHVRPFFFLLIVQPACSDTAANVQVKQNLGSLTLTTP